MTTRFAAQARIELSQPEAVIGRVCAHMSEHNVEVEDAAGGKILRYAGSVASLSSAGGAALIDASAPSLESLYFMRMAIASHILEFAQGEAPVIAWTGDGNDLDRPPNFRLLRVERSRDVTPHMRRITLSGEDVARFAPLDSLHVNLLLQQPGLSAPQWPRVGPDGRILWENARQRPAARKYTVRAVDRDAGTLDIDFVLHADAGPGSAFAESARPGDQLGLIGPGGGGLVDADWYLFAGDETALPAISRMLEHLPATARGMAFIEVADAAEIQPLASEAAIDVAWLHRNGAAAGTTPLLVDAVRGARFPEDTRRHVWVGCEFNAFRAIREHVRPERSLKKHEHLIVSYWRRGDSQHQ